VQRVAVVAQTTRSPIPETENTMSGWNSKAEVTDVVKETIRLDTCGHGLSRNPRDYNIAGIVRENFIGGYGGWGTTTGAEEFTASVRRNLRHSKASRRV
jgi:hypothetical protein